MLHGMAKQNPIKKGVSDMGNTFFSFPENIRHNLSGHPSAFFW